MASAWVLALLLAPAAAQEQPPTVVVEFQVTGRSGAPLADLKPTEVEVRQDDVEQVVTALEPAGTSGRYQLRYVPTSGRPGPVMLRLLRAGAVAAGPDGGPLRIEVEAPLSPLEQRLVPLLDAAPPAPGWSTTRPCCVSSGRATRSTTRSRSRCRWRSSRCRPRGPSCTGGSA